MVLSLPKLRKSQANKIELFTLDPGVVDELYISEKGFILS